ncbi:unnamed protein product [Candida verbasci]|uniref:peptidylprolyl isomerase n=1 Tax=Candida verbasci TaxID=1227364 RepID=A0A9W4XLR9_9ASCO|nr:unnamed protein product [Candida verbasci]
MIIENVGTKVYMDFKLDDIVLGRVVLQLYDDLAPLSTKNFMNLCQGISIDGQYYSYKNSFIDKVIKNFIIQGGDLNGNISTIYESNTTKSIPGENLTDDFNEPFKLCLANNGNINENGSQYFITTFPQPHLNGKNSIIGHVLHGKSILREIEKVSTNKENTPVSKIEIIDCGTWKDGMDVPIFNASYNSIGGDIYEEYPDDDSHINHNSSESVYNAANIIKTSGTLLLKKNNPKEAFLKYKKCLRYVLEFIPDQDQEPQWYEKYLELKKKLYLNLALVCLQLKEYNKTVDYSSYLLDMNNILKQDKAKALYRRGIAYIELKKYKQAIMDLKAAQTLIPNDESIANNIQKVEQLQEQVKQSEKAKYAKFFG